MNNNNLEQQINNGLNTPTEDNMKDYYEEFVDSLKVTCSTGEKAWRGIVALKDDTDGKLSLDRVGKDEVTHDEDGKLLDGMYDASTADELLTTMLKYAFVDGLLINRWDMYLPDVSEKVDRSATVLPNSGIERALAEFTKGDGVIEVMLNTRFSRTFTAPNLVVRKLGSKPTGKGKKKRLGGRATA